MTAETAVAVNPLIPPFIKAADVAHAVGVTRECVYYRVKRGHLPTYELASAHTRGWSRTTLLAHQPALMQVLSDYFGDKKAPTQAGL